MEAIGGDELVLNALEEHGGGGRRDNGGGIAGGGGSGGAGEVAASGAGIAEERIQVSVRLRPLNAKELARNDPSDWECINDTTIIFRNSLPERSMFPTAYTFDRVFRHDSDTKQVYEEGGKDVALSVVSGINASIFAYGQTSSGKTYTMTGITEYAMTDIYDYIQRHKEREFVLKFSAMEIYNEAVRDLLSADSTPHRLLDDPDRGTTVEKLTEETLRDWDHMKELLSICEAQRQIGETSLNETSSRSHQILRLSVESSAREFLGKDNSSRLAATVDFVDLAGSERASQTLSAGARLKEGCHINRSLLTLGTVIRKLSKGRTGHVPYRDSKLTRILHHSLGGNARTAIICTMSPARSHVEQSRNTLLFASRAKEVATSAQVNVVMSDKALVKHLQKELARLENELRCSGQNSNESLSESLLKEKDAQIQKMEKEIKELTQQRDLAQSRIKDLIRAVGDDEESEHEDGFVQTPTSDMLNINEEKIHSLYDSSSVFDFAIIKSNASLESSSDSANQNDGYQEFTDNLNEHDAISTQDSMSHSSSCGSALPKDQEIITQDDLDMKDLCREVRCIEIDETSTCKNEQSHCLLAEESDNLLPLTTNDNDFGGQEMVAKLKGESTDIDVRKAGDHFIKAFPNDSLPWPSMQTLSSSKRLCLTRSRSCKASFVKNSSSPWFPEEQNEKMVLNSYLKDFFGWPQGFQRNLFSLNYRAENETPPEDGCQMSRRKLLDVLKPDNVKTDMEEDITNIGTFSAELKAMTETQFQEQINDGQVVDRKDSDDNKIEEFPAADQKDSDDNKIKEFPAVDQKDIAINDIGLDVPIDSKESPYSPSEFEKQQREIIELWHACHVSLVHRTYFFLLFKGDPSDSIYMEVELRRLSFLRHTFSQGNCGKSMVENGYNITLASSMRALRREREMLCRQMQKRVSAEERDSLYRKWGIPLHSKQRKMQLISLLWGETRNMDRIRESASVVATLTGLLEPDQALKEMFQLSFTPQRINGRSQSRKRGMSSIM